MGIINRELHLSEKRRVLSEGLAPVVTGATLPAIVFPYNCTVDAISLVAIGLSGAPVMSFFVNRFIVGTGVTLIGLGVTVTASDFGTSGVQSASLPAFGSSLLNMLTNDVLTIKTSAANTAMAGLKVTCVARTTDDIVSQFGLST